MQQQLPAAQLVSAPAPAAGPSCRCCPCAQRKRAAAAVSTLGSARLPTVCWGVQPFHLSSVQKHSCSLSLLLPVLKRQLRPIRASSDTSASAHRAAAASCRLTSCGNSSGQQHETLLPTPEEVLCWY